LAVSFIISSSSRKKEFNPANERRMAWSISFDKADGWIITCIKVSRQNQIKIEISVQSPAGDIPALHPQLDNSASKKRRGNAAEPFNGSAWSNLEWMGSQAGNDAAWAARFKDQFRFATVHCPGPRHRSGSLLAYRPPALHAAAGLLK
jgi:hypothetical protein